MRKLYAVLSVKPPGYKKPATVLTHLAEIVSGERSPFCRVKPESLVEDLAEAKHEVPTCPVCARRIGELRLHKVDWKGDALFEGQALDVRS